MDYSYVSACHIGNPAKDTGSLASIQMCSITQIHGNVQIHHVFVHGFYRNLADEFMLG